MWGGGRGKWGRDQSSRVAVFCKVVCPCSVGLLSMDLLEDKEKSLCGWGEGSMITNDWCVTSVGHSLEIILITYLLVCARILCMILSVYCANLHMLLRSNIQFSPPFSVQLRVLKQPKHPQLDPPLLDALFYSRTDTEGIL